MQVDTEVCEQVFSWLSRYSRMTHKMSQHIFIFFILYVCNLHNIRSFRKPDSCHFCRLCGLVRFFFALYDTVLTKSTLSTHMLPLGVQVINTPTLVICILLGNLIMQKSSFLSVALSCGFKFKNESVLLIA